LTILRTFDNLPEAFRHGALAIGNFDGVHLGHARIVGQLLIRARQLGGPAVVFTFDPHPVRILRPQLAPPPLTWTQRKGELLAALGIDAVVAYPTDEAFLKLEPQAFFDEIVRRRIDARAMVEGQSFFFGHDRKGNVDVLRQLCREASVSLDVVEPVEIDGGVVSSSRVRALVASGKVDEARRMLTQPYRIRGLVVHGAGRGRQLGYPTANLAQVGTLLPGEGIYAGAVPVDGAAWPAAISIGPNPTFGEGALKVEVHLIDYRGWLYGRELDVDFIARLRNIERFASVDQLILQMDRDIAATRLLVAQQAA
jgi:riboflavin kinase/FMN adenylyltransferase